MKMEVFVRFRFEAYHCWPDAPAEHIYLRPLHRHEFHIEAFAAVAHGDRAIEFVALKREMLGTCIRQAVSDETRTWSCEQWGTWLLEVFPVLSRVSVSEDGENGAVVTRS